MDSVRIGSGTREHQGGHGAVYQRSALDLLSGLPSASVGAVITDPPFFIGIGRDEGGLGGDPWSDASTMEAILEWSNPVVAGIARVLRPGGSCVVMGGCQSLAAWEFAASKANLHWMAELTVLWNTGKPRVRSFGSLITSIRWYIKPGARHVFNSGDRRAIYSNVLVCDKVPLDERQHPAQKPVELTNFLVSLLTNEGDLVVDPYCGSGSTLVSAAMCDRRFLGSDLDENYCRVARTRAARWELEEANLKPIYLWINGRLFEVED